MQSVGESLSSGKVVGGPKNFMKGQKDESEDLKFLDELKSERSVHKSMNEIFGKKRTKKNNLFSEKD
eukprot:CAMPEP_0170549466 /NCGR_PEP_ID=MMETSP0211-20121228/7624_1 /TAXON_ID=311385 /ORGANISM="Pseudokeronopsis sp., Strain OXSARD2" /LENGTH=66 /DNA_ID=CAMNT_0010855503 /DNA_START=608 /DNA_END=808 /DNA_ORIENTATION=+